MSAKVTDEHRAKARQAIEPVRGGEPLMSERIAQALAEVAKAARNKERDGCELQVLAGGELSACQHAAAIRARHRDSVEMVNGYEIIELVGGDMRWSASHPISKYGMNFCTKIAAIDWANNQQSERGKDDG